MRKGITAVLALLVLSAASRPLDAQVQDHELELTLELMVELGLRDSYRVRQLQLEVERTRSLLRAQQARLKSRVDLQLATPEFQAITDYKWNSTLQRDELIQVLLDEVRQPLQDGHPLG